MEEWGCVLGKKDRSGEGLFKIVQESEVFIFIFFNCGFLIFPLPNTSTKKVNINNYHINVNRSSSWENIAEMLHKKFSISPH